MNVSFTRTTITLALPFLAENGELVPVAHSLLVKYNLYLFMV